MTNVVKGKKLADIQQISKDWDITPEHILRIWIKINHPQKFYNLVDRDLVDEIVKIDPILNNYLSVNGAMQTF